MRYWVAFSLLLMCLAASGGEIYCNAQGRECSDRPTASANIARTAVVARSGATGRAATSVGATAAAGTDSGAVTDNGTKADPVAEQQRQNATLAAANKTVQKDLADKRSEQCRKAQDFYKQSLEARVIYRTDKDGKRQYLSDKEADQARLDAKLEIDRTCNKGGG